MHTHFSQKRIMSARKKTAEQRISIVKRGENEESEPNNNKHICM